MARLLRLAASLRFFLHTAQARGSEAMTTATAIPTRIAYALRDDHHTYDAVVEFLSHELDRPFQACELSHQVGACYDAENEHLRASEQGAAFARALTLDDFGGRSDALGG
jgi:hypothetical protein